MAAAEDEVQDSIHRRLRSAGNVPTNEFATLASARLLRVEYDNNVAGCESVKDGLTSTCVRARAVHHEGVVGTEFRVRCENAYGEAS